MMNRFRKVETIIPPKTVVPTEFRPARPGAGGEYQGQDAEDEGDGGHQDGAQPEARRLHGGLEQSHALGLQLLGELDDQNGVLAGEADQHDQTDLAVDVVLQTAQPLRSEGAEDRHGHGEQDDERQHEALVLRGEGEIHDEQAESRRA